MQVDTAVADLSANAFVDVIEQVIENGSNGHPPDYTEPSYRERLDNCLGAYSVMPAENRRMWFSYFRRYINNEVEQEIEQRTCNLRARNATLASDTVLLRRLLSKTGNGTNRFPMDPRSLWNKGKFRKNDFHHMPAAKVRNLGDQLLKAANNNPNHIIIRRNTVYSACMDRYNSL
ncbi:unnamed protein product [Tilletia controversa]|uniref:Uncharacterized protein n=3 Tax=Tilletia TaxID=13289 RepID=A0A8X7MLH9_9BASI|nr:hypothetical protein CF328_g8292 [Tilletia controversa]KAE8183570.1 hypothetical protein CF335_g8285 [Tilletia laevis]KAE8243073.1 hypothetical protein A4X03_0g7878 [Tilletia caries]KAE8183704.1 hypothetical protein CF336_g8070 [Tilletia laevis]KAE8240947.1 hypothetical protein A4X06_0g7720 [Tilletia controversa]